MNAPLLLTADVFFACLEVCIELVPHDLTPSREFDTGQAVTRIFGKVVRAFLDISIE